MSTEYVRFPIWAGSVESSEAFDRSRRDEGLPLVDLVEAIDDGLRGHVWALTHAIESVLFQGEMGRLGRAGSFDLMSHECRQLADLLDDIREIGRLSHDATILCREVTALSWLVDRAVHVARPVLDERRLAVVRRLPVDPWVLEIDRRRIVRSLGRLIARLARCAGDDDLVCVDASVEGSELHVSVSIDQAEPAEPSRPVCLALDLELILAQTMIRRHGGRFALGRAIHFWLPGLDSSAAPAQADVLIVDSCAHASESLGRLLRDVGYGVRICDNLADASSALAQRRPHLLLVDLALAGSLRVDLAEWTASAAPGEVPVAIVGLGELPDWGGSEADFQAILPRPVRLEQVRPFLRGHPARAASA